MEISDVRRRLRQALSDARKAAADRHERSDLAADAFSAFLRDIATPVFRTFANIARAEGHAFTVFTPADAVRLSSERSGDDFMEIWLDTSLDPPQVGTRVSRGRGRHVTTSEGVLRPDAAIDALTEEDVLSFLLGQIGWLAER